MILLTTVLSSLLSGLLLATPLTSGDHTRHLRMDAWDRSYLVHVPAKYDPAKPTPVVLVLHGAGTNDLITVRFTGMHKKSDQEGFIAVYPNGTGLGPFQTWNAGGRKSDVDDVKFLGKLLDDLETVVSVDPKRIFVTGMSNGGMMCYRLANEMSERIAAIAPVAGTMTVRDYKPVRPVPVIHFHGTEDTFVRYGEAGGKGRFPWVRTVPETIRLLAQSNNCVTPPVVTELPDGDHDGATVTRKVYAAGENGAEVVLYEIEKGGHTWPGEKPMAGFIGKSTLDISANDLMWEFFLRHPLK